MSDEKEPIQINVWHFIGGVFGIGVLTGLGLSKVYNG